MMCQYRSLGHRRWLRLWTKSKVEIGAGSCQVFPANQIGQTHLKLPGTICRVMVLHYRVLSRYNRCFWSGAGAFSIPIDALFVSIILSIHPQKIAEIGNINHIHSSTDNLVFRHSPCLSYKCSSSWSSPIFFRSTQSFWERKSLIPRDLPVLRHLGYKVFSFWILSIVIQGWGSIEWTESGIRWRGDPSIRQRKLFPKPEERKELVPFTNDVWRPDKWNVTKTFGNGNPPLSRLAQSVIFEL